jgi:virginiamycin A acetyltransferase
LETNLQGANPKDKHPMKGFPQICFIKNTVSNPNIIIGDYTYYDDPEDSENFDRNVLYHFPFIGDRLIIGKFCALARGVKFIMNGANHKMSGFSTYPFQIFGNGWEKIDSSSDRFPYKGDTVIGNDVWIGYEATIMPGVKIGHGSIIAAKSVVVSEILPYTIAGGNPAKTIRQRFDDEVIRELLDIAWWDWNIEKITRNLEHIVSADINALKNCE